MLIYVTQSRSLSVDRQALFFSPSLVRLSRYPPRTLDGKLDKKLSLLDFNVFSWDFYCIDNANVCNFILSLEKWKENFFFCHSHKTFFCTKTFVDPANGQQNRHYFPLLCIFTQALVDLINNSQVFSLKLSWIFHLFAKR